ncbi:D-glycero-alpha-D-manno-heptose-1,7-bisphosphate 7-phosphatase [subsurface metagenome]
MTNRAVLLDRDGTLAKNVNYCSRPEDFELLPNTGEAIRLLNQHGFKVIVITNQSGVARGYFTKETLAKIHDKMRDELANQGAWVDAVYYCPHHPDNNCECRKPKPKLALQAAKDHNIELDGSFVVGDQQMDIDLGKAIGSRTILIETAPINMESPKPDIAVSDLLMAAKVIVKGQL